MLMSVSPFNLELDELTLARARRGDMAAREALYHQFKQPAYTVAFRICKCPQLTQDVLQDAFITAFKKLRQFRGDSPFWGWLRRVVINHAISAIRKLPKSASVELEEHHAVYDGEAHRIDLAIDLDTAFSSLDADDRTVVWLHDVEGFTHKEIAEFFSKTESFSKTRLSRAHLRLRKLLGVCMHPDDSSKENGPVEKPLEKHEPGKINTETDAQNTLMSYSASAWQINTH
jgi:RNA polymerase sigma factor (sigma-70 family)